MKKIEQTSLGVHYRGRGAKARAERNFLVGRRQGNAQGGMGSQYNNFEQVYSGHIGQPSIFNNRTGRKTLSNTLFFKKCRLFSQTIQKII